MIFLFGGLCFFLTIGVGSLLMFFVLPALVIRFPFILGYVFDLIVLLVRFYGETFVFLLRLFADFIIALVSVSCQILSVIIQEGRPMILTLIQRCRELGNFINNLITNSQNFIDQQHELFVTLWGFIVTSAYFYWNTLRNILSDNVAAGELQQDNRNFEENQNNIEELNNSENENIAEERLVQENDGHQRLNDRPEAEQTLIRNRNVNQRRNRLYPDLPASDPTDYQNVHEDIGDIRNCVVCFDRVRNIAIFPCGHTHLCLQCTQMIMRGNKQCPLCLGRIEEYRQIYV